MLDQPKLLGLFVGLVIGGVYAWWQLSSLSREEKRARQEGRPPSMANLLKGFVPRLAILLLVLGVIVAQVLLPKADIKWLVIGVAVAYGVPFVWRLWALYSQRK